MVRFCFKLDKIWGILFDFSRLFCYGEQIKGLSRMILKRIFLFVITLDHAFTFMSSYLHNVTGHHLGIEGFRISLPRLRYQEKHVNRIIPLLVALKKVSKVSWNRFGEWLESEEKGNLGNPKSPQKEKKEKMSIIS